MTEKTEETEEKKIRLPAVVPVRVLAGELNQPVAEIIKKLFSSGVLATINESVDFDTAAIIADEYGYTAVEEEAKEESPTSEADEKEYKKVPRPPVVTVMGHVDHGKTKLLDAIRRTNILETESGGITQHIGAYQTVLELKKGAGKAKKATITFLDTPGHEAFSAMRAHGANVTDIVVLVVAADDGVKPQTIEAISHARAAKVPIIVAINKIDKPEADVDRVKRELSEQMLVPEEWGGKTAMVPISAKEGKNINQLLEVVVLSADLEELKASPEKPGRGMVIEAKIQSGKGAVATVIIRDGTLRDGDVILYDSSFAKVRFMEDWTGKRVREAAPSDPVLVAGFKTTPKVGSIIQVTGNEKIAREISEKLSRQSSIRSIAKSRSLGLAEASQEAKEGKIKELNLVIKADVKGSLEAIKGSLEEIESQDIKVKIVSGGTGAVSESDVNLAIASRAVILAFRVPVPPPILKLAETKGIKISRYEVIYKLLDEVVAALEGLLEPEIVETPLGKLEVIKVFRTEKNRGIVGGKITSGKISPGSKIIARRGDDTLGELKTEAIQIGGQRVDLVAKGDECGVSYSGSLRLKAGDKLEFILVEEKLRTISKKTS